MSGIISSVRTAWPCFEPLAWRARETMSALFSAHVPTCQREKCMTFTPTNERAPGVRVQMAVSCRDCQQHVSWRTNFRQKG